MDRQARNRRELLLREARGLAERFELRAKSPWSAGFHGPSILLPPVRASYESCAGTVGAAQRLRCAV